MNLLQTKVVYYISHFGSTKHGATRLDKENLDHISNTLSQAMNSMRTSVRGLHDESIDLKTQVQAITNS